MIKVGWERLFSEHQQLAAVALESVDQRRADFGHFGMLEVNYAQQRRALVSNLSPQKIVTEL